MLWIFLSVISLSQGRSKLINYTINLNDYNFKFKKVYLNNQISLIFFSSFSFLKTTVT